MTLFSRITMCRTLNNNNIQDCWRMIDLAEEYREIKLAIEEWSNLNAEDYSNYGIRLSKVKEDKEDSDYLNSIYNKFKYKNEFHQIDFAYFEKEDFELDKKSNDSNDFVFIDEQKEIIKLMNTEKKATISHLKTEESKIKKDLLHLKERIHFSELKMKNDDFLVFVIENDNFYSEILNDITLQEDELLKAWNFERAYGLHNWIVSRIGSNYSSELSLDTLKELKESAINKEDDLLEGKENYSEEFFDSIIAIVDHITEHYDFGYSSIYSYDN